MNVIEQIEAQQNRFWNLSPQRKSSLRMLAADICNRKPHCADHSNFWRGLSARQVLSIR
jgi:hypothetical protein